jgi:RNA polymerase sigma-70 factor (ECF subfamily)
MRGLAVFIPDEGEEGKLLQFTSNSLNEEFVTMTELNTEDRARLIRSAADLGLMTDEELLAEYRLAGSPQIFEALVKRYERELYNYLRRFLGNTVLAEDAFQATFMQVHLKCHLFDGDRKVRPWLYTVATNQAIDIQRRNRRHRLVSLDRFNRAQHEELGTLVDLLRSKEVDPSDGLEHSERKEWIRDAVAALPDQLRTAVKLVYFRGLKYREAADELSVPVGTVKSRIHSAVKRLGEAWDNSQAAPPA